MLGEEHMSVVSFKERVRNEIIKGASIYKFIFCDYEYLIYSKNFKEQPYYIISANEDNYQHLTGVNTNLSPREFFIKCLNGTITETDFNFKKGYKSEKSIKGSVREKIISLPELSILFSSELQAEESFSKGVVNCLLATTNKTITLGFVNRIKSRPNTLLKGNQLNKTKSVDISLVLRRNKGADKFRDVIQGDIIDEFVSLFPDL